MNSIEIFNVACMEIMHDCLEVFPSPCEVRMQELTQTVNGYFESDVCTVEKCVYIVKWLQEENFLVDRGSNISFFRLTLSQKGLNAVNSVPSSISENKSIASYIQEGVSKIGTTVASGIMVELFKNGS